MHKVVRLGKFFNFLCDFTTIMGLCKYNNNVREFLQLYRRTLDVFCWTINNDSNYFGSQVSVGFLNAN